MSFIRRLLTGSKESDVGQAGAFLRGNGLIVRDGSGHAAVIGSDCTVTLANTPAWFSGDPDDGDFGATVIYPSGSVEVYDEDGNIAVALRSGSNLVEVKDSNGASVFSIAPDGTVHIKTGGSVHADL